MKAKIGNSISMTISPKAYESIKVESTFIIERELEDGSDKEIDELYKKVGDRIMKDIEEKIIEINNRKNRLKSLL